MSVRITRLDWALLLGLLFLMGAQWILLRPVRSVSWHQKEQAVEDRLEKVFSGNAQALQRKIENRPAIRWRFQIASYGGALVLIGSLAALFRVLFCLVTGRPLYRPLGAPPPPAWGLRQILRLSAAVLLATNAALFGEWMLIRLFRPGWLDRPVVALANTLLVDGIVLAAAAALFRRAGGYGENRPRRWTGIGFAVGSYLTFLPFLFAVTAVLAALLRSIHHSPTPQPVFTIFLSESRSSVLGGLLILVTVIGPAAEEFFFRGLLYGWLRIRLGISWALWVSAIFFAFLHADPVAFLPIFALGLLFGWVYERTGTLAAPIAIHILHNGAMLYGAFLVKTLMDLAAP